MDLKSAHADIPPVAVAVPIGGSFPPAPPAASAPLAPSAPINPINTAGAKEYLHALHFPPGLIEQAIASIDKYPLRFFVLDDSGSMMTNDGNKIVSGSSAGLGVHRACTRWEELGAGVRFHSGLAKAAGCHSQFMFLNGPTIKYPEDLPIGAQTFETTLSASPGGGTPLCQAIHRIVHNLTPLAHSLKASGKKAVIIIITDGEASDGNLVEAMVPLQLLPVWVVVRLVTNEDKVVSYWNSVDSELELDLEVLDDVASEADEVHAKNPWLNYGEPIHRLREWGMHVKEVDMLDEAVLSLEQTKNLVALLAGTKLSSTLPANYNEDVSRYANACKKLFSAPDKIPPIHNPRTKRKDVWINASELKRIHGKGGGCSIM